MSFMMASRFTSASDTNSNSNSIQNESNEIKLEPKSKQKIASEAAQKNMYGKLTRSTLEWRPAKLVCKRFNVPNPYPDAVQMEEKDKDLLNSGTMDELMRERDRILANQEPTTTELESEMLTRNDLLLQEESEDEQNEIQKPEMDIFKAIFADSDEEEDEVSKSNLYSFLFIY